MRGVGAVMIMDGDLQDPPEVIPRFVRLWREGNDVVYAVRQKRKENAVKRLGYFTFYRLLQGDQRDRHPARLGRLLPDGPPGRGGVAEPARAGRFVRGLRTFVGFRQVGLPYERGRREGRDSRNTRSLP